MVAINPATGEIIQDEKGREIPDPTPVEMPAGFARPESLAEFVQRLTRTAISQAAADQGAESFEESEDFEIDDDSFDPNSPYEEVFDPRLGRGITLEEFHKNYAEYERRFQEAQEAADTLMAGSDALRARYKALKNAPSSPPPGGRAEGGGESEPEKVVDKTP